MNQPHSHYYKDVSHLRAVDVYRVLTLFGVTDPCIQHAVKKLLMAGRRGAKADAGWTEERDVREAVDTLNRFLQMRAEDCNAGILEPQPKPRLETVQLEVKLDLCVDMVCKAVDVLQRHAPPDGLSDRDAISELYAIFDGKAFKDAALNNPALTGKPVATLVPPDAAAAYDAGVAATAQGVDFVQVANPDVKFADLVQLSDEQLSVERSRIAIVGGQHGG